MELPWRVVDVSGAGAAGRGGGIAAQDRVRFDLAAAPLLRMTVVVLGPRRHQLVLTSHHILADGWSMPVLVAELLAIYRAGGDASGWPGAALPGLPGLAGRAGQRRGPGGVGAGAGRAGRAHAARARGAGPPAGRPVTWDLDAELDAALRQRAGGRGDAEHIVPGGKRAARALTDVLVLGPMC